jgi:hypothetical protein
MQFVVFDSDNDAATVAQCVQGATSTLMGFFAANQKEDDDEIARHLPPKNCVAHDTLYQEFLQNFVWDQKKEEKKVDSLEKGIGYWEDV